MTQEPVSAYSYPGTGALHRGRFPVLLVAVLITMAVVLVLLRSEFQTGDSLNYALSIRSGTNLFHPHHLLFNPVIRGVWKGLQAVFPSADPLDAAQAHNIFWALAVLAAVFVMVRRMTGSQASAALVSLGLFACLGFWQYATLAEVYMPTMGCLALILTLLHPVRLSPPSAGLHLALLGLFCLAVFYNQISVLFALPLSFLLARRFGRKGWIAAAGFLAVSAAVILTVYIAAFSTTLQPKTLSGFVHWCLSYAYYPDPRWGTISNFSLLGGAKICLSFARNFVFVPEAFYVPAAASAGLLLAALVFFSFRAVLRRAPEALFRLALLIWLGVMVVFIWWFTPYGWELYLPLLPALFLLAGRLLADVRNSGNMKPGRFRSLQFVLAAVIAGAAAWNLFSAILPARAGRGPDYERALRIQAAAPAEATLIADFELREILLYHFDRPRILEDSPILYSFYRHWTLDPEKALDSGRPVLVSVAFMAPDSASAKPYNGRSHPQEWLSFMEWLLDCEVRDGRVVAARLPAAVSGLPGYLLLSDGRYPVDGLAGIFGLLDAAAIEAGFETVGLFSAWLEGRPELGR